MALTMPSCSTLKLHIPSVLRVMAISFMTIVVYILLLDNVIRAPNDKMLPHHFKAAELGIPNPALTDGNSKILIVSAMFPLAKSKHSKEDYKQWMKHFLGQITTDIYMYTTPDMASLLKEIRGDLPIIINTTYSSPFEIPPLKGLEGAYTRMNDVDKEKFHHSPGLYAIWNAKPFLLDSAVEFLKEKGEAYDYAFWNDAGSFRRHNSYTNWPDSARVDQIFEEGSRVSNAEKKDLLFFPIFNLPNPRLKDWREDMGPFVNPVQFSEGSFFGGSPSTISWFSKIFYAYHDHYLSNFIFVGIDQDTFNSIFLLFPERVFTVWMDPQNTVRHGVSQEPSSITSMEQDFLGECGDIWFYYQFWLADAPTRNAMRKMWMKEDRWKKLGWWQERKLCELTKASSMTDILKISFGSDWRPPKRSLDIHGLKNI